MLICTTIQWQVSELVTTNCTREGMPRCNGEDIRVGVTTFESMLGIVVSRADPASVHIGEHLLELADWEQVPPPAFSDGEVRTRYRTAGAELVEFETRHLDLERPARAFTDPTLLAVASRHAGDTGPLLTAHHTGNFGPAEHGGRANELARACPHALVETIEALHRFAPDGYDVGMECTHHGPSAVGAPSLFVEVGSGEPQWSDPAATAAVARAILDLREVPPDREPEGTNSRNPDRYRRHLVGFGGGHYVPRFERIVCETDWAVGHVAADWGLDALASMEDSATRGVIEAAFETSRATYALVDGDRPSLEERIRELGHRPVSETWVRETDGVPLALVERIEATLGSVEEGVRFGHPARDLADPVEVMVTSLPGELVAEAAGIDREETYAHFERQALAFATDDGGILVTGTVALPEGSNREPLLEDLLGVLAQRYDQVERTAEAVIARREVFEPERARTLGIPEGPTFGKLAGGEPVEVNGETIPPSAVRETEQRRFPLEE